jgi:hypothetical protein
MNLVRIRSNASWARNVAIGSCLVLGLSAFGGGTSGALITPATGSASCDVGGSASLRPGLPMSGQTPTAGWTMEKIHQAPVTNCNVSAVTGGKSVITGGVLTVNARLKQGASCDAQAASLSSLDKAVVTLKLTNTTVTPVLDDTGQPVIDPVTGLPETTSQTRTSAVVRVKGVSASLGGLGVILTGVVQQSASGNKPFGGETVEVQLPASGDCSAAPLASLPLGGKVSIHP